MILVTGATGKTGYEVVKNLGALGIPFKALIRNSTKASQITELGGQPIVGSIEEDDLLNKALEGVDKTLILLPNSEQQLSLEKRFVDAAVKAQVKHVVKMSSMEALPEATRTIPRMHVESENHIKDSGLSWTMIKPNFFMQNLLGSGKTIREQNKFFFPFANGTTAMMDVRDIGLFIAKVLSGEGHENQNYEITGPELLSFHEVAEKFSLVLGTEVNYVNVPMDAYKTTLSQFVTNQWHLDAVIDLFEDIAEGGLDYTTTTFSDLTGKSPCSLQQFIEEHLFVYRD